MKANHKKLILQRKFSQICQSKNVDDFLGHLNAERNFSISCWVLASSMLQCAVCIIIQRLAQKCLITLLMAVYSNQFDLLVVFVQYIYCFLVIVFYLVLPIIKFIKY